MRGAQHGHTGTSQLAEATQAVPLSQYGADAPRDPLAQAPIQLRHRGDRTCPRTHSLSVAG